MRTGGRECLRKFPYKFDCKCRAGCKREDVDNASNFLVDHQRSMIYIYIPPHICFYLLITTAHLFCLYTYVLVLRLFLQPNVLSSEEMEVIGVPRPTVFSLYNIWHALRIRHFPLPGGYKLTTCRFLPSFCPLPPRCIQSLPSNEQSVIIFELSLSLYTHTHMYQ
jgi:hypothetical protein